MTESERTPRRPVKRSYCAIYTRKSTDEGLEQAFNSLDAQREACAAFIQSQRHEGWTLSPTLYDDGGFSGGTLERPALKRLLADIEAGRIDVVVVYKVDRLTRALSDFAKLVEVFDRRGVSFVSITQHFNTTTSMGRLTLNVLLSFAQFEREVIGERVRDKIAASKKKGMWMGGMPSLGYDVRERKLVVNETEAAAVVHIFRRYLALKSVHTLRDELNSQGIRSKQRVKADGAPYGGHKFSRGALYLLLQNRIYRGEITHKGNSYPGEHPAIIEQPLWDEVQAVLAKNRINRKSGGQANHPSLLAGTVFDAAGNRLTPTYSVKKGTRYRYYVSTALLTGVGKKGSAATRIPAGDLERVVINRLRAFLVDPVAVLDAVDDKSPRSSWQSQAIERGHQAGEELRTLTPDEVRSTLSGLRTRVEIRPDRVEINISRRCLAALLSGQTIDPTTQHEGADNELGDVLTLEAPARVKRAGREMRMLVENSDDRTAADPSLLRIIARAHGIQARLVRNPEQSVHDIAREERVTAAHIYMLLRLPWIAPDITAAIVNGRQPAQLNATKLLRLAAHLPPDWAEQRALLGMR
jgi:DNA invertase Pin-like site-specific DNA recombinase